MGRNICYQMNKLRLICGCHFCSVLVVGPRQFQGLKFPSRRLFTPIFHFILFLKYTCTPKLPFQFLMPLCWNCRFFLTLHFSVASANSVKIPKQNEKRPQDSSDTRKKQTHTESHFELQFSKSTVAIKQAPEQNYLNGLIPGCLGFISVYMLIRTVTIPPFQ